MNKKILYKKAYRMLENSTPLRFDCGTLCNKKCCLGDKNFGMHLFPGEKIMFQGNQNFLNISREIFVTTEIFFAVCQGKCGRRFRPLSCRIYPLIPYIDRNNRINVIEDPRAKYVCPLLFNFDEIKMNIRFRRNVRRVFQLFAQDTEIKSYINTLSCVLDEYSRFTGLKQP
jgi:hypothetical protein